MLGGTEGFCARAHGVAVIAALSAKARKVCWNFIVFRVVIMGSGFLSTRLHHPSSSPAGRNTRQAIGTHLEDMTPTWRGEFVKARHTRRIGIPHIRTPAVLG